MLKTGLLFRSLACVMAVLTALTGFAVSAGAGPEAQPAADPRCRDRGAAAALYAADLQGGGHQPKSVKVYIINDPRINAFVAGGQRIFVNTGLLMQADTPNEVIGVLAHETGHIAGGHLARMGVEIESASYTQIIGMLVGLAAIAGGIAAGSSEAAQAGQGIMAGSQGPRAAQLPRLCARHGGLRRPGGPALPDRHPAVRPRHDHAVREAGAPVDRRAAERRPLCACRTRCRWTASATSRKRPRNRATTTPRIRPPWCCATSWCRPSSAGFTDGAAGGDAALPLLRPVHAGALCAGHRAVPQGRHHECPAGHRRASRRSCRRTPISGS